MAKEHISWVHNYLKEAYQMPVLENFLEFEIDEIEEGKTTYSLKVADKHCNLYGFVHGGTLASILDTVMGIACISLGKRVVTTDMSVSYIKNVSVGSTLMAVGRVISNGRTMMRTVGEIVDEQQQLLVSAHATYYVTGNFSDDDCPELK